MRYDVIRIPEAGAPAHLQAEMWMDNVATEEEAIESRDHLAEIEKNLGRNWFRFEVRPTTRDWQADIRDRAKQEPRP